MIRCSMFSLCGGLPIGVWMCHEKWLVWWFADLFLTYRKRFLPQQVYGGSGAPVATLLLQQIMDFSFTICVSSSTAVDRC